MWIYKVSPLILHALAATVLDPMLWLVTIFILFQYRRSTVMRQQLFALPRESPFQMTAVSLIYGIIGGLVGSFAVVTIGISVDKIGFEYLWPLAVLLMLINIRFLCFSYAGGIIALSYLIFGYPNIDVSQLMALVGLLHLMESVLIYLNGHHDAVPVYTRMPDGKVVGGYTLQKFWPIPLVVMMAVIMPNLKDVNTNIADPAWWPLIKTNLAVGKGYLAYSLLPVAAALGYGDIAITSLPKEKSTITALNLLIYSIVLLALAVGASHWQILLWPAALFAPLGHELVIKLGRDAEGKRKPLFQREENGIRIFEVIPNTPAFIAGLKRGDIILSVNGYKVNTKADFAQALSEMSWAIEVEYQLYNSDEVITKEIRKKIPENFGVIFPPEEWDQANVNLGTR